VYSLWDSLHAVLRYLEQYDPAALEAAKQAFRCFEPFAEDVQDYARHTLRVPQACAGQLAALLAGLRARAHEPGAPGHEAWFDAEQNALVARNAETYYHTMVRGSAASWNVRDEHMVETLERLLQHYGPQSKAIVWAHNTHIGDARATDMVRTGMINLGQRMRERLGHGAVVLVGFGSYQGSVIAADEWEAPLARLPVPPARTGSWEELFHRAGARDQLLLLQDLADDPAALEPRGHRAIGVVYHPSLERWGNFVPSVLPRRYDAFVHLERTRALSPLHLPRSVPHELPETYPSGM
jgi:erythromycin esterase